MGQLTYRFSLDICSKASLIESCMFFQTMIEFPINI